MALPTYVAAGTLASGTGALSPGLPAGIANNDILVLLVSNSTTTTAAATLTTAESFAAVTGGAVDSGPFGGIHAYTTLFWRRYDGTGGAPTVADNGEANLARIYAFRGCETSGDAWDSSLGADGDNDGDLTLTIAQALTTLGADRLVVSFVAAMTGGGSAATLGTWANADLANIVEIDDQDVDVATTHVHVAVVSGEKAAAGSVGDTTASWSGAPPYAVSSGVTLMLKPAASTAPDLKHAVFPVNVPTRKRTSHLRPSYFAPRDAPAVPLFAAALPQRPHVSRRRAHLRPSVFAPTTVIADVVAPAVGDAGVATLAYSIEDGATITYAWDSIVRKMWSGIETRASLVRTPRQRFECSSLLTDAQTRSLLATLAAEAHGAPTFLLGLPHEELGVVSSTAIALVVESLAECDWAVAGQRIVVVGRDGTTMASTWITGAPVGASIPVGSDISAVALAGARVMPALAVKLEADQGFERHRVGVMRWDLVAIATQNGYGATTQWGTGATVTTHDSMPVFDRGNVQRVAGRPLISGVSAIDAGLAHDAIALMESSDWGRAIRFESSDASEWQWLKAFLMAARGRSTAFLLPTGCPDLVAVGDASTGTLKVSGSDYRTKWFNSLAHRRIRILHTDSSTSYRTISACVDDGAGNTDLTLASAAAGAIERVEFLETARLESDEVSVRWQGWSFEVSLTAQVVQQ